MTVASGFAAGLVMGAKDAEPKVRAFRESDAYRRLSEYERAAVDAIWRALWDIAWAGATDPKPGEKWAWPVGRPFDAAAEGEDVA